MSNSLVSRYEQVLSEDPSSTVFVELAKALLDRGDADRALLICQQGVRHHPASIVGRVLWGKALVHLGHPAEAMQQFDQAISVDKENGHACNLIAEVLLEKGLYRSALPVLRKALALQPDDPRLRQWLAQTLETLEGGPPPDILGADLLTRATKEAAAKKMTPTSFPGAAHVPPVLQPIPIAKDPQAPLAGFLEEPTDMMTPPVVQGVLETSAPREKPPEGLLGDLLPPEPSGSHSGARSASVPSFSEQDSLLADVPVLKEKAAAPLALPRVEVSPQAAAAIAKEYERELHAKLEAKAQQKSFLQRHGLKLAVGTVLGLVAAAAFLAFTITRAKNHGKDLKDSLAFAKKSLTFDTAQGYRQALDALAEATSMDSSSEEAWSLSAYARALLYAEHGAASEDRAEAVHALEQPDVSLRHPGLALAAHYYVSEPGERESVRRAVLESPETDPVLGELAGRLLLQKRDSVHAVAKFTRVLELSPNNVRALVALGNYYKDSGDYGKALEFYATAAQLSPAHAERAVGAAESRLALWQELGPALEELDALPVKDELNHDLTVRREVAHARLVAAHGEPLRAVKSLTATLAAAPDKALEINLALGEAQRIAGDMAAAQQSYEAALKRDPKSPSARDGLGRVLIARDRERLVPSLVLAEDGAHRVVVTRAAAYARLADWKHVRTELGKTQVNGRFPVDSVVYLALADAAEGKADVALSALEKTRAALKRSKSELSLALGRLYWQQGQRGKARAQFEEATKDPLDYEGSCALGRLELEGGSAQKAEGFLTQAVAKNSSHGEARHALGRLLLAHGKRTEGLAQAEAWQRDNPDAPGPLRDLAFALLQAGRSKEAEVAISRALKAEPQDAESHRIRAALLFARGDGRGGFAALQRANHFSTKDPETLCALGQAYLRQGNPKGAEQAFTAAARESPSSLCGKVGAFAVKLPTLNRAALTELAGVSQGPGPVWDRGWAAAVLSHGQLGAGMAHEGLKSAKLAEELSPQQAEGHYAEAQAELRLKEPVLAKEALSRAVALDPSSGSYHLALADLLARSDEDASRAYSEYELFLRLSPKSTDQARVKRLLPPLKKRLAHR